MRHEQGIRTGRGAMNRDGDGTGTEEWDRK